MRGIKSRRLGLGGSEFVTVSLVGFRHFETQGTIPREFVSLCFDTMTGPKIDEETPLLFSAEDPIAIPHEESVEVITPLPRLQLGILVLALFAEPICSQCIYPFINQVTPRVLIVPQCAPNAFLAHQRAGHHWWRRKKSGVLCR